MHRAGRRRTRSRVDSESEVALICWRQQLLSHRRVREIPGSTRVLTQVHAERRRPGWSQSTRGDWTWSRKTRDVGRRWLAMQMIGRRMEGRSEVRVLDWRRARPMRQGLPTNRSSATPDFYTSPELPALDQPRPPRPARPAPLILPGCSLHPTRACLEQARWPSPRRAVPRAATAQLSSAQLRRVPRAAFCRPRPPRLPQLDDVHKAGSGELGIVPSLRRARVRYPPPFHHSAARPLHPAQLALAREMHLRCADKSQSHIVKMPGRVTNEPA